MSRTSRCFACFDTVECLGASVASDAHYEGGGSPAGDCRSHVYYAFQRAVMEQDDAFGLSAIGDDSRTLYGVHVRGRRQVRRTVTWQCRADLTRETFL